jgi:hypothetical protein
MKKPDRSRSRALRSATRRAPCEHRLTSAAGRTLLFLRGIQRVLLSQRRRIERLECARAELERENQRLRQRLLDLESRAPTDPYRGPPDAGAGPRLDG